MGVAHASVGRYECRCGGEPGLPRCPETQVDEIDANQIVLRRHPPKRKLIESQESLELRRRTSGVERGRGWCGIRHTSGSGVKLASQIDGNIQHRFRGFHYASPTQGTDACRS